MDVYILFSKDKLRTRKDKTKFHYKMFEFMIYLEILTIFG